MLDEIDQINIGCDTFLKVGNKFFNACDIKVIDLDSNTIRTNEEESFDIYDDVADRLGEYLNSFEHQNEKTEELEE